MALNRNIAGVRVPFTAAEEAAENDRRSRAATEKAQNEADRAAKAIRRQIPPASGNSIPALRAEFNALLDTLRDQGIIEEPST